MSECSRMTWSMLSLTSLSFSSVQPSNSILAYSQQYNKLSAGQILPFWRKIVLLWWLTSIQRVLPSHFQTIFRPCSLIYLFIKGEADVFLFICLFPVSFSCLILKSSGKERCCFFLLQYTIYSKIYLFNNFLNVQFSGVKYIHAVMQHSPLSIFRTFSSFQT